MKNRPKKDPDMEPEYDFSKGVRGKFAKQFPRGTVFVSLDPDVCDVFSDSVSVNDALRPLAKIIRSRLKGAAPLGKKPRNKGRRQ